MCFMFTKPTPQRWLASLVNRYGSATRGEIASAPRLDAMTELFGGNHDRQSAVAVRRWAPGGAYKLLRCAAGEVYHLHGDLFLGTRHGEQ